MMDGCGSKVVMGSGQSFAVIRPISLYIVAHSDWVRVYGSTPHPFPADVAFLHRMDSRLSCGLVYWDLSRWSMRLWLLG